LSPSHLVKQKVPIWARRNIGIRESVAKTLFAIASFTKKSDNANERIPTRTELSSNKWLGISTQVASARLNRLRKAEFFVKDKNSGWKLHPFLCHRKNTARLLLLIFEECSKSPSGHCAMQSIAGMARKEKIKDFENLLAKAHISGYLCVSKSENQTFIGIGGSLESQIPYLRLLAKSDFP
jgi:hypothetical protein